jgi:hypothetical protein
MRTLAVIGLLLFAGIVSSQTIITPGQFGKSMLALLNAGDSLCYYQCHVEQATEQLVTASGQTITGKARLYTITEKFVIKKNDTVYTVNYYTSSVNMFPNKKFSGLKIREKADWYFKLDSSFALPSNGLKILLSLENKGREAMEYDYPVTKYTSNQIIIKHKKKFKQLVYDQPYVLSALLRQCVKA